MNGNAEESRVLGGSLPEDHTAGGSGTTLPQRAAVAQQGRAQRAAFMGDQPGTSDVAPMYINGRVYVVPHPLRCTARTRARRRCSLWAWPPIHGTWVHIVSRYGVLHAVDTGGETLAVLREQRCRLHATPESVDYCAPEAEPFDPRLHAALVQPLTDGWVRL